MEVVAEAGESKGQILTTFMKGFISLRVGLWPLHWKSPLNSEVALRDNDQAVLVSQRSPTVAPSGHHTLIERLEPNREALLESLKNGFHTWCVTVMR